jgi:interferon gamma-inducible protein 30
LIIHNFFLLLKKETLDSETNLWKFTCQHGSDECWANLLHTCLIYYYPTTKEHFPFIHCMESNKLDDVRTSASKCAAQFNITIDHVNKCMNSKLGNDLEHAMALRTEALVPVHKYVPWVSLNLLFF